MEPVKVAVIDDEEMVCRIFEEFLRPLGFNVRSAYDCASGYKLITEFNPQFIFLDVVLPDASGMTLLNQIMQSSRPTVVIMISGVHDLTVAKAAIKAGAVDYIPKPIDLDFIKHYLMSQI